MSDGSALTRINTSVPHSARIWNYWLGGRDNYQVDRDAGDQYREVYPKIINTAAACRSFLARTVRFLAEDAGVRQFLDVGSGLPADCNTHQIAQQIAPNSRIVYVDNDPVVLLHARTLLTAAPQGSCDYVDADMGDPARVLAGAAKTLDLTQPIAVLLIGVLGHIADYGQARSIVRDLLDGLSPGSYLALADSIHSTAVHDEAGRRYARTGAVPYVFRDPAEIEGFFEGLTMAEPGLVHIPDWRPDKGSPRTPVDSVGAVARKGRQRKKSRDRTRLATGLV